ncbi:MAG: hypothetical protein ACO2ZZ_13815, partial [Cyclobacteriaceae bacterium]
MRSSTILIALISAVNLVFAQTNIPSQVVDQNTTWSLAGSPYQITGNVIIDNAALTIEPGVLVIFESDHSLIFQTGGHLIASGTAADSITFTSTGVTHGGRFVFEDTDTGTGTSSDTVYTSGTRFNYVKFDDLGTVGGYQKNTGNYESYNGNFRGPVTLLFEHCAFSNLVSDDYNQERSRSYDLLSHVNVSIFNHCSFNNLQTGWALIGNRNSSEVQFYNSDFNNISRKGYAANLIQSPNATIVNCSFSNIESRGMFSGFYAGASNFLTIQNTTFQSIHLVDYFQYVNHGTVTIENSLFYDISAPEFTVKDQEEYTYTVNNSTFEQLSIDGYLFDQITAHIEHCNFSLAEDQLIARASLNGGDPITTQDLSDNYWIINETAITDSIALHSVSASFYNDATRNTTRFEPVLSSMSTTAAPISPTLSDKRICIGDNLAFESHPSAGYEYRWYANASGGEPIIGDPVVDTQNEGTITYYASNYHTSSEKESTRTAVNFIVSAEISAPLVSNVDYCLSETAVSLEQAISGPADHLIWYETETGGTTYPTPPVPSTAATGSTDYFVSYQASPTSCESARSKITVTIYETQNAGTTDLPCPLTNVPSQIIDQNTTWSLAGSPYQITG